MFRGHAIMLPSNRLRRAVFRCFPEIFHRRRSHFGHSTWQPSLDRFQRRHMAVVPRFLRQLHSYRNGTEGQLADGTCAFAGSAGET